MKSLGRLLRYRFATKLGPSGPDPWAGRESWPDHDGRIALVSAAEAGRSEIVRALLEAGANPNARTREGADPLSAAAGNGDTSVVRILLAAGADERRSDGPAFFVALSKGHYPVADLLFAAGASPNVTAGVPGGATPTLWAVRTRKHDALAYVLRAGASPDQPTRVGQDAVFSWPLNSAVSADDREAVRLLLEHGANANLGYYTVSTLVTTVDGRVTKDEASVSIESTLQAHDPDSTDALQAMLVAHGARRPPETVDVGPGASAWILPLFSEGSYRVGSYSTSRTIGANTTTTATESRSINLMPEQFEKYAPLLRSHGVREDLLTFFR